MKHNLIVASAGAVAGAVAGGALVYLRVRILGATRVLFGKAEAMAAADAAKLKGLLDAAAIAEAAKLKADAEGLLGKVVPPVNPAATPAAGTGAPQA